MLPRKKPAVHVHSPHHAMAESSPSTASPLAYFLAGVLVPTIAYFFLSKGGKINDGSKKIDEGDGEWAESDSDDEDDIALPLNANNPSASWGIVDAPYKMVLCVNTSLGMGKGM